MSKPSLPYLLIGVNVRENREGTFLYLKQHTIDRNLCKDVCVFDVPLTLKFGSFDDLIRIVDEIPKQDALCENNIRKIQRQALEISPNADFNILWQGKTLTVDQYIRRFTWDNSKYPQSRSIQENINYLIQSVTKLDESFKAKLFAWSETKLKSNDLAKNQNTGLSQRDLIDVLTPTTVNVDDFIETEHLTTTVVYVPRGLENDWKNTYERLGTMVVPRSTKKFNLVDKDGGSLWRVLVFKNKQNEFCNLAKESKFVTRDFKFSSQKYENYIESRTKIESEKQQQESFIVRLCSATFSDLFISWMHLKAMRIFCESVLRYGVPPSFCSIGFKLSSSNKMKRLKKELDSYFTNEGYSDIYSKIGKSTLSKSNDESKGDEEEFLPFVNLIFYPLLPPEIF